MLMTPVDVISLVGGVAVKTLSPRPGLVSKNFWVYSSHRMFGHMNGVLNVDEKN
jgi:hypothetical protein